MAERVEKFALVAAAGTSSATFQPHAFIDGTVTRCELYVPAGHAGLTSWSLWFGNNQLLPKTTGATVVADDEQFVWDVDNAPTGSGYQSLYTNTDIFPHTFHIQLWLDELEPTVVGDEPTVFLLPFAS